jgi:ABC-2 type transport system ATP-binding protein
MTRAALELVDVSRVFRRGATRRVAVDGFDLTLAPSSVTCLLGPNGAGKTTTVKMASTLLAPTSGEVVVAGVDAVRRPREARRHLGLVLGGDRGFYLRATARENLRFFATLTAVPTRLHRSRVTELLATVGLSDRADDRVETFSRGMRQRLHLARALLGEPTVVLFDEPSIGLDPEGARDLRDLVVQQRDHGRSILLTTHDLNEAEALSDTVIVIDDGRTVASGDARHVAQLAGVELVTTTSLPLQPPSLVPRLMDRADVAEVVVRQKPFAAEVDIFWSTGSALPPSGSRLVDVLTVEPHWTTTRPVSLHEAYLAFIARARRIETS